MPQLQDAKAQPNLPLSISHSPDTKKPGNSGLFSNNGGEGGMSSGASLRLTLWARLRSVANAPDVCSNPEGPHLPPLDFPLPKYKKTRKFRALFE